MHHDPVYPCRGDDDYADRRYGPAGGRYDPATGPYATPPGAYADLSGTR